MIQDIEPHILNNSYDPNKKPQADSLFIYSLLMIVTVF